MSDWQRVHAASITSVDEWNQWLKRLEQRDLRRKKVRTIWLTWIVGLSAGLVPGIWIGWAAVLLPFIIGVPLFGVSWHIWEAGGHRLPGGDGY